MSEASAVKGGTPTAGALLRDARQARGLQIAALANMIKVAPRKLEALEADRFDELPDPTFTRALAQTVCRTLKIDAAPVMALLPPPRGHRLEQLGEGLNTPYRDHPGRLVPSDGSLIGRVAIWGPALLLLAALAVYLMPPGVLSRLSSQAPTIAATPAAEPVASPVNVPVTVRSTAEPGSEEPAAASAAPLTDAGAAPPASLATDRAGAMAAAAPLGSAASAPGAAPAALLQLQAVATSWIEVIDAHGQPLLSRLVQPGENVALDGALPLKVKIGNAADTRLVFRGQPLELAPFTRDNLARLELK